MSHWGCGAGGRQEADNVSDANNLYLIETLPAYGNRVSWETKPGLKLVTIYGVKTGKQCVYSWRGNGRMQMLQPNSLGLPYHKLKRKHNRFCRHVNPATAQLTIINLLLQWWWEKYPRPCPPDKTSREFAQWLLDEYRKSCREAEKVDPFDNLAPQPRWQH